MFWEFGRLKKFNNADRVSSDIRSGEITAGSGNRANYIHNRLIGAASSMEEAVRIADLYDIKVLDWDNGYALFEITDGRDAVSVIEYGQEQGYPKLELNYIGNY